MNRKIQPAAKLSGTIEVPGDKSISHRALILGSLCEGDVPISNLSSAADCAATVSCLRNLGINITATKDMTIVRGKGLHGFKESSDILDAQNSGTTMRLLTGLAAGQPFYSVLTGDNSLRRRPMKRVIAPLRQMGAHILARNNNNDPPITVLGGNLCSIYYSMPVASAQVKSAVLIAALYCADSTTVFEEFPTRDHTERMLDYFGADITLSQNEITVAGSDLKPREIFVPGDISSAVYFVAAGILLPDSRIEIKNVGLNETRTGALDVLMEMGANVEIAKTGIRNGEPVGDIIAGYSRLRAVQIGLERIPSLVDEIPILALVATQAEGTTVISGAGELRFKESDRLAGIASQLRLMGASIRESPDGLEIDGKFPLSGAAVESFADHRLAMTLSIAGLIADGETVVRNAESVTISFPEFYDMLKLIGGICENQ
ncbi:MAG: 3-phosphoshikimate 1-carboxyvinyltransferase [Candidatus Zixiibacteriota bacterium]|nr:MAG: 3-phosphoshikimate 1-carboxyvinyltransferase [candidate division Zixibacteria bacterium]